MKKIIMFVLILFLLISNIWGSEWGILEVNTEVFSGKEKTSQKYSFLLERWWDDSLGISMNFYYEDYLKYRLGLQTSSIRTVYGYFYPSLNYYTKYLNFKGLFLGIYILKDEIYTLRGKDIATDKPITALGWQRAFTPHNLANFSITSYSENYILDVNLIQQYSLPLGNSYTSEEISLLMKDSKIYISGLVQGEISIGNFSLKGYLGSNHSENFDLCDIKPGEFGGELFFKAPLTLKIVNSFSLGYFHNLSSGNGRLKVGNSLEWNLTDYLNIESSSSFEYLFKEVGGYNFVQKIQLNFPTMEGSLVGSIYWIYESNIGEVKNENQTLGLKISYQF